MTRSALPQNLQKSAGTLLEGFTTPADWPSGGRTNCALPVVDAVNGGLTMTNTTAGSYCAMEKTVSLDMKAMASGCVEFRFYIWDIDTINSMIFYFASTTNYSKNFEFDLANSRLVPGMNCVRINTADFINTGDDFANTILRLKLRVDPKSAKNASVTFISCYLKPITMPLCLLSFDDAYSSQLTNVYTNILNPLGIKATVFVPSYILGTANHLTVAQLTQLLNAGWTVGSHTRNHVSLTTLSTVAEMQAEIQGGMDDLVAWGFPDAATYFAYPLGTWNSKTYEAIQNVGLKYCRDTMSKPIHTPIANPCFIRSYPIASTTTLAQAKAYVDYCIQQRSSVSLLAHNIIDTPVGSDDWSTANYTALINYIAKERKLECVTFEEFDRRLTNPRKLII